MKIEGGMAIEMALRWSGKGAVLSSSEQFGSRKRTTVRRPPVTRYKERFTLQTMKNPPSVVFGGDFMQAETAQGGVRGTRRTYE